MFPRLTREIMKVLQADQGNARGMRQVLAPNTVKLEGFEFNELARLGGTFYAPFTAAIDRVAGTLVVTIPAFIPQNMITPPGGATHARFMAGGAEINFADNQFVLGSAQSPVFLLNEQVLPEVVLSQEVTPNSIHPLFLAFGIEFFQEVNGAQYPLKNGAYNSLSLVKIEGGA